MIFNSISKELSNPQIKKGSYRPEEYQPTLQATTLSRARSNKSFNSSLDAPEKGSTLSQMNQKIVENLQYLKYKDYTRQQQMKMSRISNRSHRSNNSHRSHHSQRSTHSITTSSNLHLPTNSRYTVKTNPNQHYFPQYQTIKPQFQNWEKPKQYKNERISTSDSNYRQFLRKPITIEDYNQKYSNFTIQNKRPEKDIQFSKPTLLTHFNTQQKFREAKQVASQDIYSVTSPVSRDWANSFGDKFPKQPKATITNPQGSLQTQRIGESILSERPANIVSPLDQTAKKRKDGMIVAFALVGLGVLLFILQTIK